MMNNIRILLNVNTLLVSAAFMCSALSAAMASIAMPFAYIILFLITVCVGFVIELKCLSVPPRIVVNVCSATILVIILSQLNSNYIIEPFMEAILAITAVKMLEKKSARDYMQLLLLNLMMLICHAMVSINKEFILYCFGNGIIWSFIMTLCSWHIKDKNAIVPLGALIKLFFRLISIFLTMIPFCLLMFIAAPRIRSPFFGVRSSQGISYIGFSDQVSLGSVGEIQKNNRLAFRAEMPKQPFVPYWRGVVMDLFNGNLWRSSRHRMRLRHTLMSGNAIKQEIYLEPGRHRYLFALDIPVSVSDIEAQVAGNGVIIYNGRNNGRTLQYTAVSISSNFMPMNSSNFNKQRCLYIPPDFLPELRKEVERITVGLEQHQKISAILNYLSPPKFEYSLTDMPETSNALEHFLFVNRKGNCEFFASAMGVMLRMAGIPSRLVGGYKGGIYNEAGEYYSVLDDSAHVWVELWDDKSISWVRYDPTPYSLSGETGLESYGFLETYFDLLDYQWTKFVLYYNLEIQGELITSLKNIVSSPVNFEFSEYTGHLPIISGIIILIITGTYFIWKSGKRNQAEILLGKFILIMKKKGFSKHKSEGLREFSDKLPEHEKIKALPFIEHFEEYYYKEKEFDEIAVKILEENLKTLRHV